MRATSGIFRWRADAERASRRLESIGLGRDRIALLVPGEGGRQLRRIPASTAEQSGVGKALGVATGAAFGLAAGFGVCAAVNAAARGFLPLTAISFWGAMVLGLVGAAVGAAVGSALENGTTDGLPADELFVYEDALRKGLSVILAFPDDQNTAESARRLLAEEGAESIDEARKQWWIGLRSARREQYSQRGLVAQESKGKGEVGQLSGLKSSD